MSIIKKEYSYSSKRQIWRLLLTETNKLIIEDRDIQTKEVFFNCIEIDSGKKIFSNFQLDEKYWAGIETIYNDIIFFHKFVSREMPDHSGIIAFDINSKKILWELEDLVFLFIWEGKIYCYKSKFESREYFALDYNTGNLLEELGDNPNELNSLRELSYSSNNYEGYLFTEPFNTNNSNSSAIKDFFNELKENHVIAGNIEFIELDNLILFNFHEVQSDGSLTNRFKAVEYLTKNVIFEEVLNSKTKTFIPDSFFIKDNFIFLLIEKMGLKVCSIKKFN